MLTTREGHHWLPPTGLQAGLPTAAVISPAQHLPPSTTSPYDVLVIGAGYAGLTATRDLTLAGHRVLLLEARDRLGGRTWTAEIDGYNYEMGGTWVHWFQPHVLREISRYGLHGELKGSRDFSHEHNYFTFRSGETTRRMTHEEEDELHARAVAKLMNVDGKGGREIMPFPYDQYRNPEVWKYADMSVADRLAEIEHELSSDEKNAILSFALVSSGSTAEKSAFLDFIRWWAAANYDFYILQDNVMAWKLKCGQTGFAMKFFEEASRTGNLSYSFSSTVSRVESTGDVAQVHTKDGQVYTKDGQVYKARRVISTVPLNVLNQVAFDPPLEQGKREAADLGHVNHSVKIHAEVPDSGFRSWTGESMPKGKLFIGAGDGMTPAGKAHCVFFGGDHNHMHPEDVIEDTLKEVKDLLPSEVDRLVFHNWSRDEFSKGSWTWYRPGFEKKYLESLRRRHGSILFASTDWAAGGWRGFIDGAIESGAEVARIVMDEVSLVGRTGKL